MPLLKTLAELKSYVSVDITTDITPGIRLELDEWEATALVPLLGAPLAAWLQAAYDAPTGIQAGSLAAGLLAAVQRPLARLAVATGVTVHQARIDNTGVHILSTETSKTAFQWQSRELQALHLGRGYNALDTLVQWLEDNRQAAPELQAWAASSAGVRHRLELFTGTALFQEYENINGSRQVFQALRPIRRRVEAGPLRTVLGDDFLLELLDQVRTRTLSAENEQLLTARVYPALASLTVGYGIAELALRLSGDGIDLAVARFDDANSKEADAGLDQLLQKKGGEAYQAGERYLRQLRDFLDGAASATRFATYFQSSAYTNPNQALTPLNPPEAKVYKFC